MPTFEVDSAFWHDYDRLSTQEREMFRDARREFVRVLLEAEKRGVGGILDFPKKLGVTHMRDAKGVLEFAFGGDLRATWQYGTPRRAGKYHIVWRRVGSHAIYRSETRGSS